VIDTGFTGYATLPMALLAALGATWLYRQEGILADGSIQLFDVYAVTIIWDGQPRTVETEAIDSDPLVGMSLLHNHELRIQVATGGLVVIEEMP
jgi:clan AA aspartic protease